MKLTEAHAGKEYVVQRIRTEDRALDQFLTSLGCYCGEPIKVIFRRLNGCTVAIKDGRYHIDRRLSDAIIVA